MAQIRNAENKANSIQDIGLTTSVQTGNSVEPIIESGYHSTVCVTFETIQNYFLQIHLSNSDRQQRNQMTGRELSNHLSDLKIDMTKIVPFSGTLEK